MFDLYVGIDYSGVQRPESSLRALQVYAAEPGGEPVVVRPSAPRRHWSRRDVAYWLLNKIESGALLLVGIDHGFSFPTHILIDTI